METLDTRLGRYELLEKIGEGGMARVYRAMQSGAMGFRKEVAIKLILSHVAKDERRIRSLINEARVGGLLRHRNIVEVYEFDQVDGQYYLAMEFVHGHSLDRIIDRAKQRGPIPPRVVVEIAMQVCAGLDYAHDASDERGSPLNLIHRDLKPANVMIGHDGVVKVMDFGIAKAETNLEQTADGVTRGSPGYMSPEQVRGRKLDRRSDLFSLAGCVVQMLTGEPLFSGSELYLVMRQIDRADVREPLQRVQERAPALVPVLRKALQREREDRHATAGALQADLVATVDALPSAPPLAAWMKEWMAGADEVVDPRSMPNLAVSERDPQAPSRERPSAGASPPARRRGTWLAAGAGILLLGLAVVLVILGVSGALVLRGAGGGRLERAAVAGEVSCGLDEEGALSCRGESSYGIGDPPDGTYDQLDLSLKHGCARGVDGVVRCWGEPWPDDAGPPMEPLMQVAVGMDHGCGLRPDGSVTCWGADHAGQRQAPEGVFTALAAGRDHTCGLQTDGTAVCWGDDGAGRCDAPPGAFLEVDAGRDHSCGLRPDDTVACWGADADGQAAAPEGGFTRISAGTGFTCAVQVDERLACWGKDDRGQAMPPARGRYVEVVAGTVGACALTPRGRLRCWGGLP